MAQCPVEAPRLSGAEENRGLLRTVGQEGIKDSERIESRLQL